MTVDRSRGRAPPRGRRRRASAWERFSGIGNGPAKRWWLSVLICACLGGGVAAFNPLQQDLGIEQAAVDVLSYTTTPASVTTPPDVMPWPLLERFIPVTGGQLQIGLSSQAHWVKLEVRNPADQPLWRCLYVGVPSHADLRVFAAPSPGAPDARWREVSATSATKGKGSAGDRVCGDLPLNQLWPLNVGAHQNLTVLVRVRAMQPATLMPRLILPASALMLSGNAERLSLVAAVIAGYGVVILLAWAMFFGRARHIALAGNAVATLLWVGMLDSSLAGRLPAILSLQIAPYGSLIAGGAFAATYLWAHRLLAPKDRGGELVERASRILMTAMASVLLMVLFISLREFVAVLWVLIAAAPFLTLVPSWKLWQRRATAATGMLWAHAVLLAIYAWQLHGLFGFDGLPRMAPAMHLAWMACVLLHHLMGVRLVEVEAPVPQEQESRGSLTKLEEEVEKRTEDLRIAREGAERMGALQRDFLATMSHELRTPMASVVGLCRMLGNDQALPERARNDMGTIERLAVHLLRMVDDGLAYVRQRGKEEPVARKPVNMRFLLRDMESVSRWLSQRQDNEFIMLNVHGMPPILHFDEQRLRQVLINLVSNAGRYCHNGQVTLGVTFSMADNTPALSWSISDSGRGMSPEEVKRVFEPFVKSRDSQGLGLGLALVRKLIDDMGGAIRVQSQVGLGTHFHISIPVSVEGESLEGMRLDSIAQAHPDDALVSRPMALLSGRELGLLRLENLRDHLRLGRLSEIEEWISSVDDSSALSPEARRFLRKVRQATGNVDLSAIEGLVDQIDPPLNRS